MCNYFNVGRPENYFDATYKQMNATNRIKEKREERLRGKDSAWFPRRWQSGRGQRSTE